MSWSLGLTRLRGPLLSVKDFKALRNSQSLFFKTLYPTLTLLSGQGPVKTQTRGCRFS